jgi:hypothetical protein
MRSIHSLRSRTLAAAGVLALVATGCATSSAPAPTDQMTVATAAVERANTVGAQAYAANELQLANRKLATAQKAMVDKDFAVALSFAQEAQADAQLAVSKTQAAKARLAADEAQTAARLQHEESDRNALRKAPGGTQ